MIIKKVMTGLICFTTTVFSPLYAQDMDGDGLGQTIQIHTQLHSFVGKPSWLLIIRDLDNDVVIPYLFDVKRGDNDWLAFTYGHDYLITVSSMKFDPYTRKINNFCQLESNGRIVRGESMIINITGDLSANTNTFSCHVLRYPDSNFTVYNPEH